MGASGSPSLSWAPMGGAMLSEYRKLVYADDRYNDNMLSFAYLKSILLLIFHKIFNCAFVVFVSFRSCFFFFFFFFFFFCLFCCFF